MGFADCSARGMGRSPPHSLITGDKVKEGEDRVGLGRPLLRSSFRISILSCVFCFFVYIYSCLLYLDILVVFIFVLCSEAMCEGKSHSTEVYPRLLMSSMAWQAVTAQDLEGLCQHDQHQELSANHTESQRIARGYFVNLESQ